MEGKNNEVSYIDLTCDDLILRFEGEQLLLRKPLCRNINNYFIPFLDFIKNIGGTIKLTKKYTYILFKDKLPIWVDNTDNHYKFAIIHNAVYLSLFDMCQILNLKSKWDYDGKSISLYWNRDRFPIQRITPPERMALIRLEDITAGGNYIECISLEKFRVIADYMCFEGIPFHIAWIPKFMDPPNGISNDISRDYSMANANFLFTTLYLLDRNGVIGLHGFTHQYDDEVSWDGTEFSENCNTDEESIRARVEAAIDVANRLELPYKFFESPHYAATAYQQSIFEIYFDIIYEGYVGIWGDKVVISPRNNRTLYVPTPLGYVEGVNGLEKMLQRINNLDNNSLASLFYHPYAEFDYITLQSDYNGYPQYNYIKNSPLHQIVNALTDKGCKFTKVMQL